MAVWFAIASPGKSHTAHNGLSGHFPGFGKVAREAEGGFSVRVEKLLAKTDWKMGGVVWGWRGLMGTLSSPETGTWTACESSPVSEASSVSWAMRWGPGRYHLALWPHGPRCLPPWLWPCDSGL